jgi:cytoskeletal protein CcmA (bactofilin family)
MTIRLLISNTQNMFNKQSEKINGREVETIIGPSVKVTGNFACEGNMVIDGMVDGNISTQGDLEVGDKSKITADISAGNARISGDIKGNLDIKGYIELTATAKIAGNIMCTAISIEKGAIFNGQCHMNKAAQKGAE